eukprot:TRINITY_DN90779_c0_g1_i1.p1 TRINITY_DN90779_c0_g1~~TRINITY_DN90779_c0_g1_i1.p1  ORF type:complete len:326 (-),score=81.60 TRINITY_DN90779_c0_g1_i1:480-1457(-)
MELSQEVFTAGRRCWPSAAATCSDGVAFYSYAEWLAFFEYDKAYTDEVWSQAIPEENWDEVSRQRMRLRLKEDIELLGHVDLGSLRENNIPWPAHLVFQFFDEEQGRLCNSIRINKYGEMDMLGGAGSRATFQLETVDSESQDPNDTSNDNVLVRLRSALGVYLRSAGEDALGSDDSEHASNTTFAMLLRSDGFITLAARGGKVIGTFLPRSTDTMDGKAWWQEAALAMAEERVAEDARFQGKRQHRQDKARVCYTFPQWVQYAHVEWLQTTCPFVVETAVWLAEKVWLEECTNESDDDADEAGEFECIQDLEGWILLDAPDEYN